MPSPALAAADGLDDLLGRTSQQVSKFLEQFSDVKCTEKVTQEKLGKEDKVELKEESTYDYLVILTNAGGELSLDESRLAVHEAKSDKKNTSMLVTNGFATLFLVFHPSYAQSFHFTAFEDEVVDGERLNKVSFQHVGGSPFDRCPGVARAGVSSRAFRHGVDRSADRCDPQDRRRHRRHPAGCWPEDSALRS